MSQPPYGDPYQPGTPPPGQPYGYPPPVDPFATTPPPTTPPPTTPPPPGGGQWPEPTSGGGVGYPPPPPGYPPSGYPPSGYPPPGSPAGPPPSPYQPVYQQPYPPSDPSQAYLQFPGPPPAPKKRRGLLITAIVLGAALLLCGGGGTAAYLFLRDADGQGAQSPQVAVNDFLVAVYTDQDPTKAEKLVCSAARDRAELSKKINEVKSYAGKYKNPKFSWPEPTVADAQDTTAKVNVKVRITTGDEKVAEQQLNFTVIKKTGWFVCEVQSG